MNLSSESNILVLNIDDCGKCFDLQKEIIIKYSENSKTDIIIVSKNSKKAKLLIDGQNTSRIAIDNKDISKKLKLVGNSPIIYKNNGEKYDSLKIDY